MIDWLIDWLIDCIGHDQWSWCRLSLIVGVMLSPVHAGDKVDCCRNRQQIGNKVDCCRFGQLCCRFWRQIGNNLNSTACRGQHCRQLGRLCCRYGQLCCWYGRLCCQCVRGLKQRRLNIIYHVLYSQWLKSNIRGEGTLHQLCPPTGGRRGPQTFLWNVCQKLSKYIVIAKIKGCKFFPLV